MKKCGVDEMRYEVLFTKLNGVTDWAVLTTRKTKECYATSIQIGERSRQVSSGLLNKWDSHNAAVQALDSYKDNVVV